MALTLAAPAILLMGLLVATQYAEGQRRFATQLTAMTRALSLATDRQIGQGQSVLQGLAVSTALAEGDLKSFERQAREAANGRDGWDRADDPRPSADQHPDTARPADADGSNRAPLLAGDDHGQVERQQPDPSARQNAYRWGQYAGSGQWRGHGAGLHAAPGGVPRPDDRPRVPR